MTLAPPPSNGDPQPVDSMTDLRFAIARARADRRAAPSSDTPSDDDLPPIGPDGVPTNCSPETCATTPSRHCCLNDYDERLTCDQCGATETDAAPFAVRGGVAGYFDYCSRACEVAHGRGTPSGERSHQVDGVLVPRSTLGWWADEIESGTAPDALGSIQDYAAHPAPSSSPVGDRVLVGEASVDDAPVWYSAEEASAWAGGWDACLRALAAADRGEPTT